MTRKIAILISGRGSNMLTLLDAAESGAVAAEVVLVLSNRADAPGLKAAKERGYPVACVPSKGSPRADFEDALSRTLKEHGAELICLAGFMRVLSDHFVGAWQGRMLNIHPSLLPLFRGLHVHEQALASGMTLSGCTVHWVTAELDGGPIIAQAAVPIAAGETPESLALRVQKAEHRLYPRALAAALGQDTPPPSSEDGMLFSYHAP